MKQRLITVPEELLTDILPLIKGSRFEKEIKEILENTGRYQTQNISYFPKKAKVKRVVDGEDWRRALLAGYAGTDFLENLYKLRFAQFFKVR